MAAADEATIKAGTAASTLMDRAGRAVARAVLRALGGRYGRRVAVVCGKGNNGGDGFVVARVLQREGVAVVCLGVADALSAKGAAREHLDLMLATGLPLRPFSKRALVGADVVVDAVFGTGFTGRAEGEAAEAIVAINDAAAAVVAVDIPSGVVGATGAVDGPAVRADLTVALAAEKIGTSVGAGGAHAGEVTVVDIGIAVRDADALIPAPDDVASVLPRRAPDAHKRSGGAVALLAGSEGMTGAAVLAARGALRSGAGYATAGGTRSTVAALGDAAPEALTRIVTEEDSLGPESLAEFGPVLKDAGALGIGPGLRNTERQRDLVRHVLEEVDVPVVLDADALNVLVEDPAPLVRRSAPTVITPHPGEMARLIGSDVERVQSDRLDTAKRAAERFGCAVLLKGRGTIVARPDGRAVVNPTGGPALATAGTGDVLTGAVAALLAGGLDPFEAAWAAAYLHGLAGDLAANDVGAAGVLASDVAERLAHARRGLQDR